MRALGLVAAPLLAAALSLIAGAATAQTADDTPPPLVERILTGSAIDEVPITATFTGQELFVYGAIDRNRFLEPADGFPDVVIVARGPASPIWVRRKARVLGVWMNVESIRIASAPSYFAVAGTRPIAEAVRADVDATYNISLDRAVVILGLPTSAEDPEQFRQALVRIRREAGLYREQLEAVTLRGGTLFQARFELPSDIVEGDYEVTVYLLRDGDVRDQATIGIQVYKHGLEQTLGWAAAERPLVYALGTLLIAAILGWGANELFRRLRR